VQTPDIFMTYLPANLIMTHQGLTNVDTMQTECQLSVLYSLSREKWRTMYVTRMYVGIDSRVPEWFRKADLGTAYRRINS
jgi:hypothetical protein